MAFYLKSNFTMNKGVYGELFWCGYQDDDTIYIAKKLKDVDFSLYIEKEAAIRLSSLPTVYNVKSLELHEGKKYLVSKYVSGPLLKDYYSQNMENIFLHILCTLEVMGRCGVCHNDLHTGNIIITKSDLTHVKYCFGSEYLTVNVNGELPVLIDYGQANIENYRYRPVITGLDLGNFASLIHDNRFDKLKIYYSFKELLEPGKLRTLISHLGKPTLKNLSVWVKKNVGLLWNPINLNLEYKFIKVFDLVDYHTSGMFLSFPPITMPDYDTVYDKLDNLENIMAEKRITPSTVMRAVKTGSTHPHYKVFCILGQLLRTGADNFIKKFKESMEYKFYNELPLNKEIIQYMVTHHPQHIFKPIDSLNKASQKL